VIAPDLRLAAGLQESVLSACLMARSP